MKNKGFTLLELLAVMLIMVIIFSISLPRINQSMKNAQTRVVQSEMVKLLFEIERLVTEEMTYQYDAAYNYGAYQIVYSNIVSDTELFKQKLEDTINDLPDYFSYEISVINSRFQIAILYPGVSYYRNLDPKEIYSASWPIEGQEATIKDGNGLDFTLYNNANRSFGNEVNQVLLVELAKIVFDVNP
jgi:prepilin-type N-terminal cleavage/methylation domain-containing protein